MPCAVCQPLLSLGGGGNYRLGAVDGRGGVTGGLERWEIDPLLIKNPGTSLGTGSFGTVFKAELHGKPVAVKKLSTQKFDDKTLVRPPCDARTHAHTRQREGADGR